MSRAVELLKDAVREGVEFRVDGHLLLLKGRPSADLVAALRAAKPEIMALLRGDACRICGERINADNWRDPAGPRALPFADGTSVHVSCDREDLMRRAQLAVLPLNDPAEGWLRGEVEE
ncbi:MAG: hypothetical protein U1E45_10705 [Geminicoccaceae bacterium]